MVFCVGSSPCYTTLSMFREVQISLRGDGRNNANYVASVIAKKQEQKQVAKKQE